MTRDILDIYHEFQVKEAEFWRIHEEDPNNPKTDQLLAECKELASEMKDESYARHRK